MEQTAIVTFLGGERVKVDIQVKPSTAVKLDHQTHLKVHRKRVRITPLAGSVEKGELFVDPPRAVEYWH